jgi:hypothetical protein
LNSVDLPTLGRPIMAMVKEDIGDPCAPRARNFVKLHGGQVWQSAYADWADLSAMKYPQKNES